MCEKFNCFKAWENIKLQLDDVVKFKILNQQNFAFGNLKTSSDVFVGGVPKVCKGLQMMIFLAARKVF